MRYYQIRLTIVQRSTSSRFQDFFLPFSFSFMPSSRSRFPADPTGAEG